jgi:hypothetical protein
MLIDERDKGLIPLSQSGSGLRTVILVLLNLIVYPWLVKNAPLSQFIFAFEELENNLHPAVQRRLFMYLRRKAVQEGCYLFLTTHSNVVIDLFGRDEHAQILHVTHDGQRASVRRVTTYVGHRSIFDDLEVRASDVLQTNCVVWVEGPSDRVYFNKWVDVWTGGELKEHVDYEVCFSAGTLLAHYSFDDPVREQERIQALRVNRNAVVLIDSDKTRADDEKLKARAERVANEVSEMGGIAWITDGKEVENYIPNEVLEIVVRKAGIKPKNKHANIFTFLKNHRAGDFSKRKVELAEKVCEHLTREMLSGHLDLGARLENICDQIRRWNRERPSASKTS